MSAIVKKQFKIYSPLSTKSVNEFKAHDDGERILLEGVASTKNRDLQGDIVSQEAIKDMQAMASQRNIHGDHEYGLFEGVIGAVKEVIPHEDKLSIKFLVRKKFTEEVRDMLETGINLGLSIGGIITDYDKTTKTIKSFQLMEISLTAMPANWDTYGTVTTIEGIVKSNCLSGACYTILKNLESEEDNMSQEENNANALTVESATELFNELMAEKEKTIVEEVVSRVNSNIEAIVDSKFDELNNNAGESNQEGNGEGSDGEKSFDPETIKNMITEGINAALGDDFAGDVASKMFGNIDQQRSNKGSKFDEFMKKFQGENPGNQEGNAEGSASVKTYSTEETSKILLNRQRGNNPIIDAAMKNL